MQQSKVYRLLVKFGVEQQNMFRRFVESRSGKSGQRILKMVDLMLEIYRSGEECSREAFFAKWQNGLAYDSNLLSKNFTFLKGLLDQFLVVEEVLGDSLAAAGFRMKALSRQGWSEFAESEYKAAQSLLNVSVMDQYYYSHALEIEEGYLGLWVESVRRASGPTFQRSLDLVDLQFIVQKLRYASAAFNQDRIIGTQHRLGLLEGLLEYVSEHYAELPPLVRIYYHIYMLHVEPTMVSHFESLMLELNSQAARLTPTLSRELYQFAINHCTSRLNAGERQYAKEIERIYELTLDSKVLLINGKIDGGALKNMIAVVLLSGNITFAETLLREYGPCLLPESDPASLLYNQALIYYHQGEYGKARKLCDDLLREARDAFVVVDARLCLWRASYALGDLEYALMQYDAFRMYLSRVEHLSPVHLLGYRRFAKGFVSLIRIRLKYGNTQRKRRNAELEALLNTLLPFPESTNIRWLRQQINETLAS